MQVELRPTTEPSVPLLVPYSRIGAFGDDYPGAARAAAETAMKGMPVPLVVLYVRIDNFGEGLLRIPAIRAARTAFPDSRIVYGSNRKSALETMLRRHVDHLIDDFRVRMPLYDILRELRPRGQPAAVADFRSAVPTLLANRLRLVGRPVAYEANFPGFLLSVPSWRTPEARPEHEAWRNHRLVERLAGFRLPFDHRLSVPETARARAREIRGAFDRPLILVSGNARPSKRLTDAQVAAVAGSLIDEGFQLIYLQSPGEGPSREALAAAEPRLAVVGPAAGLSGDDLQDLFLALGEMATAFVGAEGGMSHLMATVMAPMVVLNPGGRMERWWPLSNMVEVIDAAAGASNDQAEPAVILAAVHRLLAAGSRDHPGDPSLRVGVRPRLI